MQIIGISSTHTMDGEQFSMKVRDPRNGKELEVRLDKTAFRSLLSVFNREDRFVAVTNDQDEAGEHVHNSEWIDKLKRNVAAGDSAQQAARRNDSAGATLQDELMAKVGMVPVEEIVEYDGSMAVADEIEEADPGEQFHLPEDDDDGGVGQA